MYLHILAIYFEPITSTSGKDSLFANAHLPNNKA